MSGSQRVTASCPVCGVTIRARFAGSCPAGHGAMVPIKGESHRKRPGSPSDRPPVGDEPGSLFDVPGDG